MSATQQKKDTRKATVASVIWPGLGQAYNGQIGRGIIVIILAVTFAVIAVNAYHPPRLGFSFYFGIFLFAVLWVYGVYDALNTAKTINEGAN